MKYFVILLNEDAGSPHLVGPFPTFLKALAAARSYEANASGRVKVFVRMVYPPERAITSPLWMTDQKRSHRRSGSSRWSR